MSAIVAGIINTRTGEIIETTDNSSAKVRLSLKVRDELNAEHGKDAFMVFELNLMGGMGNVEFVKNKMQPGTEAAMRELDRLQAIWRLEQTQKELDRAQAELSVAEQAKDECLELFSMGVNAAEKREFVDDALSEAMDEMANTVRELKERLGRYRRRVNELTD